MIGERKLFNRMGYVGQLGKLGDILFGLRDGLDGKVNAEEGKVLSSNDFTDEYRQKLYNLFKQKIISTKEVVVLTRREYLDLPEWDSSTLYVVTYTDPDGAERLELFVGNVIVEAYSADGVSVGAAAAEPAWYWLESE